MSTPEATGLTVADLEAMPDDMVIRNLIDGELFVTPAPTRIGEQYTEGPPDLVVEVSSPSTRRLDLLRKRRLYERFAVPEYWFVDLDADRVEAYRLADQRYGAPTVYEHDDVAEAAVLEGFSVAVAALLAG